MSCLGDESIFRLAQGTLTGAELAAAQEHLVTCADCRRVLADTASELHPAETVSDRPSARAARELPRGARLDRYVIDSVLGRGGMGIVYAAQDSRLHRRIALKVVASELEAGASSRERLVREARTMARLSHPNVVAVHDVGTVGDEVFVAMELVEGTTLRAWLKAEPRSTAQVVDAFLQAGSGLAAAHRAGLVHRDFKPENVLVGNDGRVRVTDFGLARAPALADQLSARAADLPATGSLTRTGTLLGTPAYMAPEQLNAQAVDARADQFAYCVAFYEALCGQRPFHGATVAELSASVVTGEVAAPPRTVDAHIFKVLRRGLSVEPRDRWLSLEDLMAELGAKKPSRRPLVAALAAAALGLGGVVTYFVTTPPPPVPAPVPVVVVEPPPPAPPEPEPVPEPAPPPAPVPAPVVKAKAKPARPHRAKPQATPAAPAVVDDDAALAPTFKKGNQR
ncbi:MAG: serine/threonine protein kinase [Myxococcaceae bacterium]|nr:serine/threonine protein kinase [Myxococcaceae bacterium]